MMDADQLLATIVQSGAAMVAIVAGLLIGRIVLLVGERRALERRVVELALTRDAILDQLKRTSDIHQQWQDGAAEPSYRGKGGIRNLIEDVMTQAQGQSPFLLRAQLRRDVALQFTGTQLDQYSRLQVVWLELEVAREALRAMGRPGGLVGAMSALALIAVTSIVAPLAQMTIGSAGLSAFLRVLYSSLFVLSILIFFAYMAWEIRRVVVAPDPGLMEDSEEAAVDDPDADGSERLAIEPTP